MLDLRTLRADPAAVNGGAGSAVPGNPPARTTLAGNKPKDEAAPAEDDKKSPSGLANVISLAQRIRALQRNGS